MKKWYVITGILALLLLISLVTCSGNSAEVDRVKTELANIRTELASAETELANTKAELGEIQSSYDALLFEYNKLKAGTSAPLEEAKTPLPQTQTERLPYSWTEGIFLITIQEFVKYDERGSIAENYDWYKLRVSYKNTSHSTTKANINIGDFKLKTGKGNLYDMKYAGCESCYDTFDPEAIHDYPPCTFRIQKGEEPVELWLYKTISKEYGWPKYAEDPSIIFELEN